MKNVARGSPLRPNSRIELAPPVGTCCPRFERDASSLHNPRLRRRGRPKTPHSSLARRRGVPLRVLACRPASAHSERVDQSKFGREPKPNTELGCCQSCDPTKPADRLPNPSVRTQPSNSLMATLKNLKKTEEREDAAAACWYGQWIWRV